jgi:ubiquinone/menaquinone biosynthesis C-methylase UbiE
MIRRLNLGCGPDYRFGWINLDIDKKSKADVVHNIEKKWPFPENTFDYVYARHVLEHIHQEKFDFAMSELRRVCKKGAIIEIFCPYFSSHRAFNVLTHHSYLSYFFSPEGFKVEKRRMHFFRVSYPYKKYSFANHLLFLNPVLSFLPNTLPLIYERLFCWTFPMEEIYYKLRVIK